MKIRYPFKNEPTPTTDNLVINVSDGDGVAISGATVSIEEKAETGTVTVTCVNSEQTPLENADVRIYDSQEEVVFGVGYTDSNGTVLLKVPNEQYEPTEVVANIPFGTYIIVANGEDPITTVSLTYKGELTIDGDENVTITLSGD